MSGNEIPAKGIEVEVMEQTDFSQWITLKGRDVEIADDTPYEAWYAATQTQIDLVAEGLWAVGKLLATGERLYGEKYAQVIDSKRYSPKTLMNAASVYNSTVSQHRDDLSYSHHAAVARLEPDQQKEMLDIAAKDQLPVAELAELIKEKYPKKKAKKAEKKTAEPTEAEDLASKPSLAFEEAIVWADAVIEALKKREQAMAAKNWNEETKAEWKPRFLAFRQIGRRMEDKN